MRHVAVACPLLAEFTQLLHPCPILYHHISQAKPAKLAACVLDELPGQMSDFFNTHGTKPPHTPPPQYSRTGRGEPTSYTASTRSSTYRT